MGRILGTAIVCLALSSPALAQVAPPVPRPGAMAIPAGNDKAYDAGEAAAEGVARGIRAVKDKFAAKGPLVDPLGGLLEGTTVVVRKGLPPADTDAADESDQPSVSEATVAHIEKVRTQLTLRFDDGKKITLQLADKPSAENETGAKATSSTAEVVSLTYTDDTGRKATRVFTKIS